LGIEEGRFEQGFYRILRRNLWRLGRRRKDDVNMCFIVFEAESCVDLGVGGWIM